MRDQRCRGNLSCKAAKAKSEAGNRAKTGCNGRIKLIARRARCVMR